MDITLHWQTDLFNNALINDPRLEFRIGSNLNPLTIAVDGIYIIWADTNPHTILKVGSGQIKNRLREHINDSKVQPYKRYSLYVTWATIPWGYTLNLSIDEYTDTLRGIEKFIGLMYPPKLVERLPVKVDFVFVDIPELETPLQKLLKLTEKYRPVQESSYQSPLAQALANLKRDSKNNPFR